MFSMIKFFSHFKLQPKLQYFKKNNNTHKTKTRKAKQKKGKQVVLIKYYKTSLLRKHTMSFSRMKFLQLRKIYFFSY